MKRKLVIVFGAAALMAGCNASYDDTPIKERLDALDARIEALAAKIELMNSNVEALASLAQAYSGGSTITAVEELKDSDGNITGYRISFTNLDPIVIHNGVDGTDGYIGVDGTPGKDGTPGHSPVVNIELVDGVWYWTVDGEILKDSEGQPVQASPDPSQALAKDGETPVISVESGNWVVTVGGSSTVWGPVSDSEVLIVDGVFASVDASGDKVVFTLSGGHVIELPKAKEFAIVLEKSSDLVLAYTVEGALAAVSVDVLTDGSWTATVSAGTESSGTITLSAPAPYKDASVLVLASNGTRSASASFSIISGKVSL